ncbi:MAG: hypothetical protein JWO71_520 [Candidatus Acidoferrum typicum]|nr:hypothetical protein [Candidatus Acidoferrum typicum]
MLLNRRTFAIAVLGLCTLLSIVRNFTSQAGQVTSTLLIGGSKIDVTIESGEMELSQTELLHWAQSAAEAVATYYGRYPVPRLQLRIIPVGGSGVRHGQTFGYDGGLIKIRVGKQTEAREVANDWMLTHEMVHLSFPSVADEHHWIEEGIAVYVEPIARIQAKQMSGEQMWADLVRDMPKGLPQEGDEGMDHTHTWGRTYWGGALFCFVADVEIRKQTHNRKGLQDALRGILDAGGNITHDWELTEAFKIGDRATGTTVLSEQYAKWKDKPAHVDLASMWKELGIAAEGKSVRLREDAPLAGVRLAITAPAASKKTDLEISPTAVFAGRASAASRPRS